MRDQAGFRECARGSQCADATQDDAGEWHGQYGDRAFCAPCEGAITGALRGLPTVYRELREIIGDQPTGGDESKITVKRTEAPMPLRADVDALCTEIESVTAAYEDRVRQGLGMGAAPAVSWAHRADRVAHACGLLVLRYRALLALPLEWTRINGVHDERGGADAGLDLLDVYQRAHRTAAPSRGTFAVPVGCPRCGWSTLLRRGGEDHAWCPGCSYVVAAPEYQELTRDRLEDGRMAS